MTGAGCSKSGSSSHAAPSSPASATSASATGTKHAKACEIVTQAEMSAILGGAVTAAAGSNERPPSQTECIYSPAQGSSPYAELEVDWEAGDPQTLGTAAGVAGAAAPAGAVDPLHGLGERAYQVTPDQVFISTGGNLMMVRFPPGSADVVSKVRRIYETTRGRM